MAEYTKEQLKALRDRWKGHEKELKALIPVIKADEKWHESEEYRALMDALDALPEGVEDALKDLRGAHLMEAHLEGAYLIGAHLEGAYLWRAHLEGADLAVAHLEGAHLGGTHLEGARLMEVHLEGAGLMRAHLEGAYLMRAHLKGADLMEAHLEGADLMEAYLSNTKSWLNVKWNSKKGKKLKPCERKTVFGVNDIRNANWAGAEFLERYVKDENFLVQYKDGCVYVEMEL